MRNQALYVPLTLSIGFVACATPAPRPPPIAAAATMAVPTGDVHDFDFIAGAWTLQNRRLKARGVGSKDWEEFPATDCGEVYLSGVANVDELRFPTKGWAGVTVRTFDLQKKQWSIFWVSSRRGVLLPPVVGGFTGDRGEFFGDDDDDGRPVRVRFTWTKQGPDHAHWEQAFSYDRGKTWEVNWMNDLTRADPSTCTTPRTR